MKKCLFLLLTCFLVLSCTQAPQNAKLRSRISKLESRVDIVKRQLDKEIKTRKDQYSKLKNSTGRKPSSGSKPTPTPMNASTEKREKEEKSSRKDKQTREQSQEKSPEKRSYSSALNMLLAKNKPQKAQQKFERFLEKYPDSDLVPNTYYWLGETYYVQRRYEQSILYFKKVYNNFPDDPKAPDAMLKTGYAYAKKGDLSNAKFYLNNLVERNPNTKAAKLAQKRLNSLNKTN